MDTDDHRTPQSTDGKKEPRGIVAYGVLGSRCCRFSFLGMENHSADSSACNMIPHLWLRFLFLVWIVKNMLYRKAIIQAIDELHDFNLRSNIESIRRHLQSTLGPEHIWNDALFLKTIKALSNEGIIEQCASVNYGLSPEFKRRRTQSCVAAIEKTRLQHRHHSMPDNFSYPQVFHHHDYHEKDTPIKKSEHAKLKILPKKIYEGLHVPLKNPMETDRAEELWH